MNSRNTGCICSIVCSKTLLIQYIYHIPKHIYTTVSFQSTINAVAIYFLDSQQITKVAQEDNGTSKHSQR